MPTLVHHIIEIRDRHGNVVDAQKLESGIRQRLHIVRGHYSTYTAEAPLFGPSDRHLLDSRTPERHDFGRRRHQRVRCAGLHFAPRTRVKPDSSLGRFTATQCMLSTGRDRTSRVLHLTKTGSRCE